MSYKDFDEWDTLNTFTGVQEQIIKKEVENSLDVFLNELISSLKEQDIHVDDEILFDYIKDEITKREDIKFDLKTALLGMITQPTELEKAQ